MICLCTKAGWLIVYGILETFAQSREAEKHTSIPINTPLSNHCLFEVNRNEGITSTIQAATPAHKDEMGTVSPVELLRQELIFLRQEQREDIAYAAAVTHDSSI